MHILLDVPQILQNPELPNGCEITSCCELLHYLGFEADKCELADDYLPQSAHWYGADPNKVYMGNPRLDDASPEAGYYCFAGPIVAAADAYLSAHGGGWHAQDLTGCEEPELIAQLQKGRPFLFWASLHFADIQYDACGSYALPDGGEHRVFHQLHCMVAKGADDASFFIADPLNFNTAVPRAQFMKIYRQLGSRAVVLLRDGDLL
jgi:uncharacterized protein YvpB